jgi:hypothetical protein
MLGYTVEEIESMRRGVLMARKIIHPSHNLIQDELYKTAEFIEGLLVEGRI